jgi:hypothetical protein
MNNIIEKLSKKYTLKETMESVKDIVKPVFYKLALGKVLNKFNSVPNNYKTNWTKLLMDVNKSKTIITNLVKGLFGTYSGIETYLYDLKTDKSPKDVTMIFAATPNKKEQSNLVKVIQKALGNEYMVVLINGDETTGRELEKYAIDIIKKAKEHNKKVVFVARDMGSRSFSLSEIDTVMLMFDRGLFSTVAQKISRVLTSGITFNGEEKVYGYIISLSLDPNRDDITPIDEYILHESEKVQVNELSDGIRRVYNSINIFGDGYDTELELDSYSEKLISASTLIRMGRFSANPNVIMNNDELFSILTGIDVNYERKRNSDELEGIDSSQVEIFVDKNVKNKKNNTSDGEENNNEEKNEINKFRQIIIEHLENIVENIVEISEINDCESDDVIECLTMIKEKGLESEVIFELDLNCDTIIKIIKFGGVSYKMLNTIITSYNKYEKYVDELFKLDLNDEQPKVEYHKNWKQNSKKGEVFTSNQLINELLDRIPVEVWKNPKSTFCDPCMGRGTFIIAVVNVLVNIYGYSLKDAKSRVYGYDIRPKYVNHLKRRGYKNVYCKDSLIEKFKMKFDVVLGNPPYQINDGGGTGSSAVPIYHKFLYKSLEISDRVIFITPSRWFKGGKGLDKFREDMLSRTDIKLIKHFENEKDCFDVELPGGVSYLYIDKNYSGLTKFIDGQNNTETEIQLNTRDILVSDVISNRIID